VPGRQYGTLLKAPVLRVALATLLGLPVLTHAPSCICATAPALRCRGAPAGRLWDYHARSCRRSGGTSIAHTELKFGFYYAVRAWGVRAEVECPDAAPAGQPLQRPADVAVTRDTGVRDAVDVTEADVGAAHVPVMEVFYAARARAKAAAYDLAGLEARGFAYKCLVFGAPYGDAARPTHEYIADLCSEIARSRAVPLPLVRATVYSSISLALFRGLALRYAHYEASVGPSLAALVDHPFLQGGRPREPLLRTAGLADRALPPRALGSVIPSGFRRPRSPGPPARARQRGAGPSVAVQSAGACAAALVASLC
jgi:hypothetical protein